MSSIGEEITVDPLEDLLFDPHNPRLPHHLQGSDDQSALFKHLVNDEGIDDLVSSISENGFLSVDPMLVIAGPNNKFIVIEGNRRLAAMTLLASENARRLAGIAKKPAITESSAASIKSIKVQLVESATSPEVVAFLGYKHVTGARPWGPEEKARYVLACLESGHFEERQLARMLGVTPSNLYRPVSALRAIKQAKAWGVYDFFQDRKVMRAFGTLYTAFNYKGFKYYLRITEDSSYSETPVPEESRERLGEVLNWLFGSKSKRIEPILPESRKLADLDRILLDESAVQALRDGASIDDAFLLTDAAADEAIKEIRETEIRLRRLLVSLYTMRDSKDLLHAAKRLSLACEEVLRTLESTDEPG